MKLRREKFVGVVWFQTADESLSWPNSSMPFTTLSFLFFIFFSLLSITQSSTSLGKTQTLISARTKALTIVLLLLLILVVVVAAVSTENPNFLRSSIPMLELGIGVRVWGTLGGGTNGL
ncbi:uncharacterized protein DS421_20g678230 [Arachis hypogaea]|nr:uncharacterized protein DS421_20g678230 [Arachis hypogaea]